jgi:hypothetical protein
VSSLIDKIEITVRSLSISADIDSIIDEQCEGMERLDAQAFRMMTIMGVVVVSCREVGAAIGQPPQEVLEKLMLEAAKMLGPRPEPKVEKPAKPRPEGYESPWGRVR